MSDEVLSGFYTMLAGLSNVFMLGKSHRSITDDRLTVL